jgi:tRNA(Arg) A34 adenosine deaminase TadA
VAGLGGCGEAQDAAGFEAGDHPVGALGSCRTSKVVAKADRRSPIADPLNHAGVLIEWAAREHRA